jgi:hypothetical protein
VIISASYKTDIPAFYGEWFLNRIRAGYCKIVNPYNAQILTVPLGRDAVDGFVFWTKNLTPFFDALKQVRDLGYPFVLQYTINGYPRKLEFSVTDADRSIELASRVALEFGPRVLVWRYDPIILSSETTPEFHISNFTRLAQKLEGVTDEVVVSFAQIYKKTERNMNWAAKEFTFTWHDPDAAVKRSILREIFKIARLHRMNLVVCSQPDLLEGDIGEARCVDARRLSQIAGSKINAVLKGNRQECGCYWSKDIGEYDTCPHGCVYCYAVRNRRLAQARFRAHDPESEFLFRPPGARQSPARIRPPKPEEPTLF